MAFSLPRNMEFISLSGNANAQNGRHYTEGLLSVSSHMLLVALISTYNYSFVHKSQILPLSFDMQNKCRFLNTRTLMLVLVCENGCRIYDIDLLIISTW